MVFTVKEYAVQQFRVYDGKKLNSTTKEGMNLGDQDEKKKHEEPKVRTPSSNR